MTEYGKALVLPGYTPYWSINGWRSPRMREAAPVPDKSLRAPRWTKRADSML